MDIQFGIGVGPLRFGMTPAEVEAVFVEPDSYESWMGGNLNGCMLYQGMVLGFDRHTSSDRPPEDARLIEVTIRGRKGAQLLGRPIEEWSRREVEAALRAAGLNVVRMPSGDINVVAPRSLMELSFDRDDALICVGLEGAAG